MSKINKQTLTRLKIAGQLVLAVAALIILIITAVELGISDSPAKSFVRDSVWRIFCCGCITLIFPYLAISQIKKDKRQRSAVDNDRV